MKNPVLRFKDKNQHFFPDWTSVEIGEIGKIVGGGTPSTKNEEYWNGEIDWLTPSEISSKYRTKSKRTITKEGLENSSAKLLPPGTLILTTRATLGACSINDKHTPVCTNQGFQSIICSEKVENEFLYYIICGNKFQNEMSKRAGGSTFKELSPSNLKQIEVSIPCKEEQQKIASFFSTLDEKIELSERKQEALEQLKKGLMQKIFSQEIRFKSGGDSAYPTWEAQMFADISEISSASRVHKNEWTSEGIRFFRSSDVVAASNKVKNPMGEAFISQELYNSLSAKSGKLSKGDILVTGGGSIGIPYLIKDDAPIYSKDADLLWVKVKQEKVDSVFLYFYMLSNLFKKQLKAISHTGTISHLTIAQLKQFSIDLPSLEEQKKIGQFFQTVEQKIDVQHKKIAHLKKLKQGFMQQMFV